jgi:hypothetical protein
LNSTVNVTVRYPVVDVAGTGVAGRWVPTATTADRTRLRGRCWRKCPSRPRRPTATWRPTATCRPTRSAYPWRLRPESWCRAEHSRRRRASTRTPRRPRRRAGQRGATGSAPARRPARHHGASRRRAGSDGAHAPVRAGHRPSGRAARVGYPRR